MAKKFLKHVAILTLVVILLIGVLYFTLSMIFNSAKNKGMQDLTLEDLQELSNSVSDERINILMLGVDSLSGQNKDSTMRTDTIMLFSIDPETKTGFVLSIPRDTRIHVDGSAKKFNKINEAHSIGGVASTIKTVKTLLGMDIHHFVKVDYQAVNKTVNDIGGVEVNVPMDMVYDDPYANPPLHINLKQGPQLLDGDKAMQFLRFRHGYANQDLGRIESQQKFIQAVLDKVLSTESIVHITDYLDTFSKYVQTDMDFSDMLKVASKGIEIKPYNIKKAVLPGVPDYIGEVSYFIPDTASLSNLIAELYDGQKYYVEDPLPTQGQSTDSHIENITGETPQAQIENNEASTQQQAESQMDKVPKNDYNPYIVVLNGNGRQGLAQRADDLLYVNNIPVEDTANADNFDYSETMIYYKNNITLAQEVKRILGTGRIVQENKAYYDRATDILIVLGADFTK